MSKTRRHRLLTAAMVFALLTEHLSAQLLSKRFSPAQSLVKPVVAAATDIACSISLLSSSPKLDDAVQRWVRNGRSGKVRVIVSASPGLLAAVRNLVFNVSGTLLGELPGINASIVDVDSAGLSLLNCSTSVSSVSIDAVVAVTGDATGESGYSLRAALGLPLGTPAGAGVGVAVVDSGIAHSVDFGSRLVASYDFTNGANATTPSDGYGHGTHVAGLIAGSGSLLAGSPYQGLGPQARLIGMKVLDAGGSGRTSDVIRAVEYATARRAALGIQIINLSLGHPIYEAASRDPLVRAVEAASRAGIVVVVAAGNYGTDRDTGEIAYAGITSPGNAPSAITVGSFNTQNTATRSDDGMSPYSSRGPSWYDGSAKPDMVAPGHGLVSDAAPGSTLYSQYPSARVSTNYLRLSGTSMAAAVTSGAVALILEANRNAHPDGPPLTPNAVKAILQYSSLRLRDRFGVEYDDLTQGAGALNAAGALHLARSIDTARPTGSYWWTTSVAPSTILAGEAWTWSQHIVWGSHIVWGTSIDTNGDAWSLDTVWGGNAVWGSHIVWGSDVVWGSATQVWANHIVWGTNFVGMSTDGQHIVWGTADQPSTTVWGNVADSNELSGSASTGLNDGR